MPDVTLPGALAARVLSILLAHTAPDAADPDHYGRLANVAGGIELASDWATCSGAWRSLPCTRQWPGPRTQVAAVLYAIGDGETGFRWRYQAGHCRIDECDGRVLFDGVSIPKSAGPFQVQRARAIPPEWHAAFIGTTPTAAVHQCLGAARAISIHRRSCKTIRGALSGYATGKSCDWSGADARERRYRVVLRELGR